MLWTLVTPFLYLTIKEKRTFDFGLPLFVAVVASTIYQNLDIKPALLGDSGILKNLSDFLTILAGFFIAALSAVVTFQSESLDKPVKGTGAQVEVRRNGAWKKISLSRRRFLGFLFGYLTAVSFLLYFLSLLIRSFGPSIAAEFPALDLVWIKFVIVFVYSFLTANVAASTFYGLHYLVDRMHYD